MQSSKECPFEKWKETLQSGNFLREEEVISICSMVIKICPNRKLIPTSQVKDILMEESNVQPVSAPAVVIGDLHGQFYDFLHMMKLAPQISDCSFVFLVQHSHIN
jgi:hypothetical protein